MSESREHFLRISKLFLEYKMRMIIAVFCMIVSALCTGFHAWLVKPALDQVLVNANQFYLYLIPAAILITGIIKGLASYIQVVSLQFMSQRIIEKLRKDVFHNLINLHYGFFVQNKTGSLITRITTDTFYLSGAMANTYTALIKDSLTLIVLIGNMFYQNWKLALISIVVFPLALIPVRVLGRKIRNITKNLQYQIGNLASNLEETFKGIKNVIITMGSKGVFFMSEDEMAHIEAENVNAIDTTAAGDTFNGALATAFSHSIDMIKSIKFSNAAAAFSVTKLGAQSSIPSISQLDKKFQDYVYS